MLKHLVHFFVTTLIFTGRFLLLLLVGGFVLFLVMPGLDPRGPETQVFTLGVALTAFFWTGDRLALHFPHLFGLLGWRREEEQEAEPPE